ncbi:MAG TPA: hypothetical protein VJ731_02780, partial [Terriglobales bacterium]|nr:hypothetical protein [Terriglobales bacterium]
QIKWVEEYLRPLKEMGLVEPEEERRQWCFHIMVAGAYGDYRQARIVAAQADTDKILSEIVNVGLTDLSPTSTQQSAVSIQPVALNQ